MKRFLIGLLVLVMTSSCFAMTTKPRHDLTTNKGMVPVEIKCEDYMEFVTTYENLLNNKYVEKVEPYDSDLIIVVTFNEAFGYGD